MTPCRFFFWIVTSLLYLNFTNALHADDIGDAVKLAKAKHTAELARLRETTLDEIDAIIRREQEAGVVVNFYLKERKGFAENGVVPLLPKLLPATKNYTDGKKRADAALESAYSQAIEDYRKAKQFDQALSLKLDLQKLREQASPIMPKMPPEVVRKDEQPATAKDAKIEADIVRAKAQYSTAMKVAATELLNGFEEQRTKVATSKTLTNEERLKQLEIITKEKAQFEAGVSLPKSLVMRASLKQYEDSTTKPRQTFATAMDAAASAHLEKKDTGNAQVVTAEKKRLLVRPNSLDLLAVVDPQKDTISGSWQTNSGTITMARPTEYCTLQIPFEPASEYNLHLRVERLEGNNYFAIGLVASGRQTTLMFDGWPQKGGKTGLQLVDNKFVFENPTDATGFQLPLNKIVQIDVAVRKDVVAAWVTTPTEKEPRQLVNFKGEQNRLSVEGYLGLKNSKTLFVHVHTSRWLITAYELEPVGKEEGKLLR